MKNIITDILILALLCFIWGNSTVPVSDSAELSDGVLSSFWEALGITGEIPEWMHTGIRKLAHFCEYALLGFLCALRFISHPEGKLVPVSLCVSAAIIDETVQLFADRGSRIYDVLLDSLGAAAGVLFAAIIFEIIKRNKSDDLS